MNLPELEEASELTKSLPFSVQKGKLVINSFATIEQARECMRNNLGAVVQYHAVTSDVIRYEELFDTKKTDVILKILEANTGLAETVLTKAYHARVGEGELLLEEVYDILRESEESWVGINLNKVCLQTVRSWILDRINGNTSITSINLLNQ